MAITFTSNDLVALKQALLTGANEVQIGDRRVKYNSPSEILRVIRMVEEYLNASSTDSIKTIQASYSKGNS